MIYQTDIEFAVRPQISHGACYFLSILRPLADRFGKLFTHEAVLEFYDSEIDDGDTDVDNEMFVGNPQNLIDDYIGPGKVLFVGAKDAFYIPKPGEIAWGCWHRVGTNFNHFTYGIRPAAPDFYDPWSAIGSASVKQGKIIGQRIARYL